MRKKALLLTAVLGTGFILASCGGGGSTTTSTSDGSTVSAYITDAPADQYPAVEVTLYEVRLTDGTNSVTLFSSDTGIQIDLTDLRNVMRYVGSAQIPAGQNFNTMEVVVDGNVTVTTNSGNTLNVSFENNLNNVSCDQNNRCTITITNVSVSNNAVAVDFDLQNMQIDENTNTITQMQVVPRAVDPQNMDMEYEIAGKVVSVGSNSFTVDWLGRQVEVSVDPNTTVCPGLGQNCLPQQNWCVEVETSDDPAVSQQVRALEIERKMGRRCGEDDDSYREPVEVSYELTITDPSQINVSTDANGKVTSVSVSEYDANGNPTISISVDTYTSPATIKITENGNSKTYNLSSSFVCEMESEMEGMEGNMTGQDADEEDRRHQELANDYRRGPECFTAMRDQFQNLQNNFQNQNTMSNVEVKFELKVDPNTDEVIKLELEIEAESEGEEA